MFHAQGLDPELLRAFQLIAEGNSFTQAAERLGRTQSAVSMQMKRLEDILGQTVLSRGKGGGITLTTHGRYLLTRARQILALNDEVIATFRAPVISRDGAAGNARRLRAVAYPGRAAAVRRDPPGGAG
jgi:DNA-binding transcriptional LysR family regulator